MQHFWHIILYYFKKHKNATETQKHKRICTAYGEGAVTDQTCQKWFAKFLAGQCSVVCLVDQVKLMVIKSRY